MSSEISDHAILEEATRLAKEGVCVTLPVKGYSMLPFIIGGKDSVILQKPKELKVGDVVLAWVEGCRYVVHRIIQLEGNQVVLMGDGNIIGTEHCTLQDVCALATHVIGSDGKQHDLYSPWRQRASQWWRKLRPIRRYLLAVYRRTFLKIINNK